MEVDGSGWVKVKAGYEEGLVPFAYLEILPPSPLAPNSNRPVSSYSTSGSISSVKKQGPAVAPRRGAKKLQYVEALYEYDPEGGDKETQHSMVEGERFVLIKDDTGDGWMEVERGGVVKIVPANYVKKV